MHNLNDQKYFQLLRRRHHILRTLKLCHFIQVLVIIFHSPPSQQSHKSTTGSLLPCQNLCACSDGVRVRVGGPPLSTVTSHRLSRPPVTSGGRRGADVCKHAHVSEQQDPLQPASNVISHAALCQIKAGL